MISSYSFQRLDFERKVNDALNSIERILSIERHPRLAGDVDHSYGSKFALVDATTNAALIAYMNVFDKMGLSSSVLQSIDNTKATTLRFAASMKSKFEKEVIVDVPMDRSYEEEHKKTSTSEIFGNSESKRVSKVVQHIKEYHYTVETKWTISLYSGTAVDDEKVIKTRTSSTTLITQSKDNPIPRDKIFNRCDLSLTWLLKQIDASKLTSQFKVDMEDHNTKTPRRNKAVEDAVNFSTELSTWSSSVNNTFTSIAGDFLKIHNPALFKPLDFSMDRLNAIFTDYMLFNPILPLMEESKHEIISTSDQNENDDKESSSATFALQIGSSNDTKPVLSVQDLTKLLSEHVRTMEVAIGEISKSNPNEHSSSVMSSSELDMVLLSHHINEDLCKNYIDSMTYVESMMETQLVSALGKRLSSDDLDAFVRFHDEKLLSPSPKPFSHAISRPNHYPVGLLSIEGAHGSKIECIYSHSRLVNAGSTFKIPLNAAPHLELEGDQILHGWLHHRFGHDRFTNHNLNQHHLVARARQFSSFILVIGTMTGPSTLEPKDAIICQNKDELFIPIILSELPTAKEFKDAVKSLSPKQQEFARAFRSMQLESSVFGVCIVQIKPQLEKLLGLSPDALDKEMKLTQDLMELFVDYQVPSDLLSYNGVANVATEDKISNVKQNVKAVMDVINNEKEKTLKTAQLKTEMAIEEKFQTALASDGTCSFGTSAAATTGQRVSLFGARATARRLKASPMMAMAESSPMAMDATEPSSKMLFRSQQNVSESKQSNQSSTQTNASSLKFESYVVGDQDGSDQSHSIDFTLVPKVLDAVVEKSGKDISLRSTVLKTSDHWMRDRQANLLSKPTRQNLGTEDIKKEKNKAVDLLDALSRSGSLPITSCELHVLVAVTHCFDKDVIGTVVRDNINPIEKIEKSTLLFASTIHGVPARNLIKDSHDLERLEGSMPLLLQQQQQQATSTEHGENY